MDISVLTWRNAAQSERNMKAYVPTSVLRTLNALAAAQMELDIGCSCLALDTTLAICSCIR